MSIWVKPYDLNLEEITRDAQGNIVSGWVINGAWFFEIKDGEVLCRTEENGPIVNRHPHDATKFKEVNAPRYKH